MPATDDLSDDEHIDGAVARRPRTSPEPTLTVRLLLPLVYLGCLLAFIADMSNSNALAFGVAYVPLICTAVFHRSRVAVWWLAGIAIVLVALGFFFPRVSTDVVDSIGNRLLSVVAIVVTAALVRHSRQIQDRLTDETARAEAAERLKTEVFTNLSNEIRTPLHAIIGFAELMMANCRPDQRPSLGQMRMGGQRLLATIDNLIDLTTLDRRALQAEVVDLARALRQSATAVQFTAAERQVSIILRIAEATVLPAICDAWAVRRILDNLIANALKFTRPGGSIELSADAVPNGVRVTIEDTGIGMSAETLRALSEPLTAEQPDEISGTGLALCRQLVRGMGGALSFDSRPDCGTTVSLWLPAPVQASR
jgi:signal transduction histidine kinase